MILILGNSSDSLLYLKNMLRQSEGKKESKGAFSSYTGKLYGQDVMLAETGYSSYRSGIVASYLMSKYKPYFVVYIGDAMKISSNYKIGDILLPDNIKIVDVNELQRDSSFHLNEVPGFSSLISIQPAVRELFTNAAANVQIINIYRALILSSNTFPQSLKDIPTFDLNSFINTNKEEVGYESEVGGIALASTMLGISFMPILTVSSDINVETSSLERKKTVLGNAIDIGKIIISFIAAISSNENNFIRGDEFAADKRMKF